MSEETKAPAPKKVKVKVKARLINKRKEYGPGDEVEVREDQAVRLRKADVIE